MKRFLIASFTVLVSLSSQAQSQHCLADRYSQTALFDSSDIQITTGVHYATSMRWPGTQMDSLRMDVYQPSPTSDPLEKRPLIVMMHGGAYAAGNKNDIASFCFQMARRGYVSVTVQYRLGWDCIPNGLFTACSDCSTHAAELKIAAYRAVQDHRAAMRHMVHYAEDFGIDTAFVFVGGVSAGSIATLHSAHWNQSEADTFCPTCTDEVGLLDTTGNDLTDTYTIKGIINNCGAVENLDILDGHNIPIIGFHDDGDCSVPYNSGAVLNCGLWTCSSFFWARGSNLIRGRLAQSGTCYQMNTTLGPGHCSYYDSHFWSMLGKSTCFLKSILCGNCTNVVNDIWNVDNVPNCSAGGTISIQENEAQELVKLNGNRLILDQEAHVSSIQIFDLSMRLLVDVPVNGTNEVQLPTSLRGCMVVKVDTENSSSEVKKWCNF